MTAHSLTHVEATRRPVRRGVRNGTRQLGWAPVWLLVSSLGGSLGGNEQIIKEGGDRHGANPAGIGRNDKIGTLI